MEILYHDKHLAVCRKAWGEVSEHTPDGTGTPDLLAAELGIPADRVHVVHRLDRTTGGLMVFALEPKTAASLSAQIQDGRFRKIYLAAVEGITEPAGAMTDQLYFDRGRSKSFVVRKRPGAKEGRLTYETVATAAAEAGEMSLCRIVLETGRTHQIRVQFGSRQHPLVGDGKYGGRIKLHGCALWSAELAFTGADGSEMRFTDRPDTDGEIFGLFAKHIY